MTIKKSYSKPALTVDEQIKLLQSRNLHIESIEKARHILSQISYYRLSGYFYPLLEDKEKHKFKSGASFNTAFSLYCFDRELRSLVINELEKIEVSFRTT